MKTLLSASLICSLLLLTGCTSFMAMTSDGPIAEDYGKRTMGTVVEDGQIESKAKINISRANETLSNAHFEVTSYNRILLITGQVPDEASKTLAGNIAKKVRHVRRVHNELEIAGPTSFLSRTNDNYLSTKVKARLMGTSNVDSSRVEVVVENGKVYLMGLMTQLEAKRVVATVQKVSGIQKIIKVFEYISEETS